MPEDKRKTNKDSQLKLTFLSPVNATPLSLPLFSNRISAGFPSPADDYLEKRLDLNEHLIRNPSSTFLVRVTGTSMQNSGIYDGDILVVDRSIESTNKRIVIGVIDGEFTVKRIIQRKGKTFLVPENDQYKETEITENMDFSIWGVVTFAIHKL